MSAVVFPMPFCPTSPRTTPGEGMGRRNSLNVLGPNLWLHSASSSSAMLIMDRALKGHFLTQMPQPTQRDSTMTGMSPSNLMASILLRTGGQKR